MSKEENEIPVYILIYGSLRKGMYNYERFDMDVNSEFIKQINLKGFKMYSLDMFPYVVKTDDENDEIIAELYKFKGKNKEIAKAIRRMELGAGYDEEFITVNVDGKYYNAYIYVFDKPQKGDVSVPNGDWVSFKGQQVAIH